VCHKGYKVQMGLKKLTLIVSKEQEGKRLDQVLAEWLPIALGSSLSKAKVRKLIVAGAVYLNGARVRIASKELRLRAKIDAFVDLAKLMEDGRQSDQVFEMSQARVLFEDEFLIAVDKPPGLPTQPTLDEARDNLFASVKKFLKTRDHQPDPYLGLHHRLDRDTSGVILFTKKTEANAGIGALFAERGAQKTYNALVSAPAKKIEDQFEIKNYLAKAGGSAKRARFTAVRSGGDFAHTSFRVLGKSPQGALWMEAMPHTGRTHQIRVHLSEAGMPIWGDATYGGDLKLAPRLMLHAVSLTFEHPIKHTTVSIISPFPKDFSHCLRPFQKLPSPRKSDPN
jgi:23S rRNA pseudouridine1911/1915/1917 synthase